MFRRKLLLFFCSLGLLCIFFLFPRNREWAGTVTGYWKNFGRQWNQPDKETRMRNRFRNNYIYSKNISDTLKKRTIDPDAVILMPPTNYFNKMGMKYHVPEPAVFYYYTGTKTVWANSPGAIHADWYVRVSNGAIILEPVTDRQALRDTITAFKNLGVSL